MSAFHAWLALPDRTHLKVNASSRALELWDETDTALLSSTAGAQQVHATAYGAKGDGATDDTAEIQAAIAAAPAGSVLHLPENSVCSGTITIAKRLTVTGGRLLFNTGVTNSAAIDITAAGVILDGVTIVNPNELQSPTGGRNIGIQITANEATVHGCTVDRFQNGIVVQATGEYGRIRIINNRIIDVIGTGGGPASGSSDGEDRGDGIVVWGAQATITGNVVNAKAGTDARIGIHCEGLAGFAGTPGAYSSAMFTTSGNIVYGQFRRGISYEDVSEGVITGNSVADSTWWAVSLANNCRACVVDGNAILWTRAATDNQGSAYTPMRTPILAFGTAHDSVISNNTMRLTGAADAFIGVQGATTGVADVTISGNTGYLDGGTVADGMRIWTTTRVKLDNNRLTGFTGIGTALFAATDIDVYDNHLTGGAGATHGIQTSGTCTRAQICRNTIQGTTAGINLNNHTSRVSVLDNTLRSVTGTGVDLFGCNSGGRVGRNDLAGTATTYANLHTSITNLDLGSQLIEHTDSARGTIAVNDVTIPAWPVPAAGTLTSVRVTVGEALVGGGLTVRFDRIAPAAFAAPVDVTLAAGAISGAVVPTGTFAVAAGDLIQATVTALTATNVTALASQMVVTT